MGLDYSYEIVFQTINVNKILNSLMNLLSNESKERMLGSIPWVPEITDIDSRYNDKKLFEIKMGINGIEKCEHDRVNSYCLSFSFPLSDELSSLCQEYGLSEFIFADSVIIGCIWVSICVGEKWGLLSLKAATSTMSKMFEKASIIRKKILKEFCDYSEVIIFDKEEYVWNIIYPKIIDINIEDIDEYMLDCNVEGIDVDSYLELVVNRLHLDK